MPNWPALLLAPTLALTDLAVNYALVTPSCTRQNLVATNLVSAAILLICLLFTVQAWRNRVRQGGGTAETRADAAALAGRFIALVAAMVGALSCLVVLAIWFPQWILSPCAN
jgi:hypothetical protein